MGRRLKGCYTGCISAEDIVPAGLQGSVSGGPGLCGQELGEARRADTLTSLEPGTGEREREREELEL